METGNSAANHAVLYAQTEGWGMGPIETINSDAIRVVLHAQNDRWGLGLIWD